MTKTLRTLAWALSGIAAIGLLTLPIGNQTQLALGGVVIGAMLAIWWYGHGKFARWSFLALGSLVVCRYLFWRVTGTLPPLDQPMNFALGLLLLMAELYCVLILVISLIINADPLERPDLARDADETLPTVDVFIPTYNEDGFILATTIAAAKSMDYPAEKLTVWLLDDGGTDQKCADANPAKARAAIQRRADLQQLCDHLGAVYLTRARNEHAKAGNLNNGLLHATSDIVAVFDADHAPFRSFLRETIGHFALDAKLFLVQTPHVFLNPDPIERNLRTFERMPSENEMFYSVTQRGLDKWNGSFFCGSAALLRREALDVVGGFSGITITEDCETAFELHSKGWTSVYVDKPLIAGLQPETLESFIGQRSRWCQGMFQLLLLKNPIFAKGLKPIQKIAYLSSMVFWLFPIPRLVFTIAPLLHIFFDVKIFVSSMDEAIAYTTVYMIVNLMLQNYLYGHVRWPFMSELYEYVQGVYLAKAIVAVVMKPRSPTFNVTAKGVSMDEDHLSGLSWPFFAIFGLLAVGAITAFYRYMFEPGAELMLIVGLWTTFNLIVAGAALGVVAERREPDRFPRLTVQRRGLLAVGAQTVDVAIHSVSAGGCSVHVLGPHLDLEAGLVGTPASLVIEPLHGETVLEPLELSLIHATLVEGKTSFGFAFVAMRPVSYMTLADLMYGDPKAILGFLSKRRTHMNLVRGSLAFIGWGVKEPVRAFSYLLKDKAVTAWIAALKTRVTPIGTTQVASATIAAGMVSSGTVSSKILPPLAAAETAMAVSIAANDATASAPRDEADLFDALVASGDRGVAARSLAEVETTMPEQPAIAPADWLRALMAIAARETAPTADQEQANQSSSVAA